MPQGSNEERKGHAKSITMAVKWDRPAGIIEKLRRLRIGKDITQRDLAAKLRIAHVRMSEWECGRKEPLLGSVEMWAKALGAELTIKIKRG